MRTTLGNEEDRKPGCRGLDAQNPAEQGTADKAPFPLEIAHPKASNTESSKGGLLGKVVSKENMRQAYMHVKRNKGAAGIDGINTEQMHDYFKCHIDEIIEQIEKGKYKPDPVKRAEIPKKEKGKTRELGIPTVRDRVVQQAIAQMLTPIFEPKFCDESFGFRPNRSAHDALRRAKEHADAGYVWVVDMDLEKFFDTVVHSKLIQLVSDTVEDGKVVSLIHKYLNAGALKGTIFEKTEIGVPQGGPLSPLLANILLNELDQELKRRGHRFVRYADDCMIFLKSRRAAERVCESITLYIEGRLFLKVNRQKTKIVHITDAEYLGYGFDMDEDGICTLKFSEQTIYSLKEKIKAIFGRSKGIGYEQRKEKLGHLVTGWCNYFKLANHKYTISTLKGIDGWMRRRIRAMYWKAWKLTRTKYKMLVSLGINPKSAKDVAGARKSYWRMARNWTLHRALGNQKLKEMGYMYFTDYFEHVCAS